MRAGRAFTIISSLLSATAALAHHGPGAYDYSVDVEIEGTVANVEWRNPHLFLTLETTGADGRSRLQKIEAASLSSVQAFGLRREMVVPGTHVVVVAHPRRQGVEGSVKGASITLDNHSTYLLEHGSGRGEQHVAAVAVNEIAGKWTPQSSNSFGDFLRALAAAPLTDKGRASLADVLSPPQNPAASLCATMERTLHASSPFVSAALYVLRTLTIGDKTAVLRLDADGVILERIIHLDQRNHTAASEPSPQGHSIGHWEGETLVADTARFTPVPPNGASKHVVERFSLTPDRLHLRYEFTWEDPELFTAPFAYSMLWDAHPELAPSGAPCDEENARRSVE
jgi:Family of unknown function (DUF6152)